MYYNYVHSHHFPWLQPHDLQSIRFSGLTAIQTHYPMSHVSLEEAPSRLQHTVFLQRGCCCQGKEVVPVDHIRGKGLSSHLTSGSKIRLTAGFELCPQGPAPSSLGPGHTAAGFFNYHGNRPHSATVVKVSVAKCGRFCRSSENR